ncbi:hypothetical protein GALMADRAFT_260414, partial [Galerina marginata CBS 339.88]
AVMQRARLFATRLLQLEPTPSTVIPPTVSAEIVSREPQPVDSTVNLPPAATVLQASWPTPAPATFTISYTPLSTSHPDPPNSVTRLPTDVVRVTQHELELMLHQSYIHGSEHGWKPAATQALQARYDKDMLTVTSKFDELLKQEFTRGLEQATVRLKAKYEQEHLDRLFGLVERAKEISDEDFNRGFNDGRDAGIREESERRESARAELTDYGTQTELPLPTQPSSVDFGAQTELSPEPDHLLCVDFSMQTEPPESEHTLVVDFDMHTESPEVDSLYLLTRPKFHPITIYSPDLNPDLESHSVSLPPSTQLHHRDSNVFAPSISIPVSDISPISYESLITLPTTSSELPIPDLKPSSDSILPSPSSFIWSDEPSDILPLLPTPPLGPPVSTSFLSRDFSDLRSGANPWQSLQHRKGRDRRYLTQPRHPRERERWRPSYMPNFYPNTRRNYIPRTSSTMTHELPPNPSMPLDWYADPRLSELSRVLKTLGWAPPSTT